MGWWYPTVLAATAIALYVDFGRAIKGNDTEPQGGL
jgi:hypothetical protein